MKSALEAFESAFVRRQSYGRQLEGAGTDSYRLFCGEGEGIAGLKADKMGPCLFLYRLENRCPLSSTELKEVAQWSLDRLPVKAVYLKEFVSDRSKAGDPGINQNPAPLLGEPQPEEIAIRENGLQFLLRPFDGFSTGLFLDQRDNRRALGASVGGLRVLNLFAYTCGFSVYAARGGANVTSVDLSTRYLDWGKRNFSANDLLPNEYEFFSAEAFHFLKGAKKRGRRFDVVVLDPPSFSRDRKGGVFSIAKDARRLAEAAAQVVTPGGRLFFSTNYEQWNQEEFRRQSGLAALGKSLPVPPVPKDFEWQSPSLLVESIVVI